MKGKTAIITGAARGVGYGTALCLARKGADIVIGDMNASAAQESAAALARETGVRSLGVACDVTRRDQVEAMVAETRRRFGHIDILVNNAGICPFIEALKMTPEVFTRTIDVNVTDSAQADHAASKAGLHVLMKSFAIALGKHGITCNAVAPGMILTDMTRHHWEQPEPAASIKTRVPVGRIGIPEDIGNAVALLCAEEASYINGVGLIVDGGHQAVCV